MKEFSSPSRGSYISTIIKIHFRSHNQKVLVPFPGFLYLYDEQPIASVVEPLFSSPSRGSYISTNTTQMQTLSTSGSRPLPGVLISLPCPRNPLNYIRIFLLLRRKCNSIPYTDLIPHKIQDNVLFSTMRGKTGRYWEQLIQQFNILLFSLFITII